MFYMLYFEVCEHSSNVTTNTRKYAQIAYQIGGVTECWWDKAGPRKLFVVATKSNML